LTIFFVYGEMPLSWVVECGKNPWLSLCNSV